MYKLYFAQNVNPTDVDVVDMPKYNDFWSYSVDIPNRDVATSIYKGERYNLVEWRKVVLYPQRAGKLEIKPLSLDVTVNVPLASGLFPTGDLYTSTQTRFGRKPQHQCQALTERGTTRQF